MAELSPNLQRLDRGRIQQTPVSPNRHQQRTEDQRTHHQRPSPIIIHIGQKFRLGPTKILSENRVKGMFLLKPRFECFHIGVIHVFLSFIFKFFLCWKGKIIKNWENVRHIQSLLFIDKLSGICLISWRPAILRGVRMRTRVSRKSPHGKQQPPGGITLPSPNTQTIIQIVNIYWGKKKWIYVCLQIDE